MAPRAKSLAEAVTAHLRPALKARGFAAADLIARWRSVVGDLLADHTAPERLIWPAGRSDGASLRVRVSGAFAAEVQHLEPLICERINTFFGYRAVVKLQLIQGPLPRRKKAAPDLPPLTPAQQAELDRLVAPIADPKLRESLARLGAAVLAQP